MIEALQELDEEQSAIDRLLTGLDRGDWDRATPSDGWTVKDQVSHLADTNEVAVDTLLGGPRSLNEDVKRFTSPDAFTQWGVERGRTLEPSEVLAWWRRSSAEMRDAFMAVDPKTRVPWGLGMQARTLVTARLMEHWAHAVDIRRAVGESVELTPRLRSVAWLILNAVPYALAVAECPAPEGRTLRLELDAGEETWRLGPDDATDVVRGDAVSYTHLTLPTNREV